MHVTGLLVLALATASDGVQMKDVSYRGGIVEFSIPAHWVEEYEPEGGGTFYSEQADSGTLRLSVITFARDSASGPLLAAELLRSTAEENNAPVHSLPGANAYCTYVSHDVEDGEAVTIFWWEVSNVVDPDHARIAIFSYSVPRARERVPDTTRDVEMLDESIRAIRFHASLGE